MSVRVRLAPSPTGMAHVGTARTALFNWLFARHHAGTFILRLEDTDRARFVAGGVESVEEMLAWLGIAVEEGPSAGGSFGPYVQSERLDIYQREVAKLLAQGSAYRCYCTAERLTAVREAQQRAKQPPGYDRHCRFMADGEREVAERSGLPSVIRLAVPLEGTTEVLDEVRGSSTFQNAVLQDAVLIKSDGFPTYQFASPVDDHLMEITHVLRGDEWLASQPLHAILFQAFGWELPKYAHLPLILGKDRAKLSKRHGDTSFGSFIARGYLPDALFNFLGLLGWSLDDHTEIIARDEFVRHFDLDRVGKSPAVFDWDKLDWMNSEYLKRLPEEVFAQRLTEALRGYLRPDEAASLDGARVHAAVPLVRERLKRFEEAGPMIGYLFEQAAPGYSREELLGKGFAATPDSAALALDELVTELQDLEEWQTEAIWEVITKLAERLQLKLRDLAALVRIAITGRSVSPPLPESMALLGQHASLHRLQTAVDRLQG